MTGSGVDPGSAGIMEPGIARIVDPGAAGIVDPGGAGIVDPGSARIGLERLSLNQATVKYLSLAEAVALCVRHDIPAIGLWRDRVAEIGLADAAAVVRAAGLHVSSLCRGGFFTRADPDGRRAALEDN